MGSKSDIHPVDPTRQLPGAEVAEVLRRIGQGRTAPEAVEVGRAWSPDDPGKFAIRADGYEITLFNDQGSVDYVERATAPDGRRGSFTFWYDRGQEPVVCLADAERRALEDAIVKALGGRRR